MTIIIGTQDVSNCFQGLAFNELKSNGLTIKVISRPFLRSLTENICFSLC